MSFNLSNCSFLPNTSSNTNDVTQYPKVLYIQCVAKMVIQFAIFIISNSHEYAYLRHGLLIMPLSFSQSVILALYQNIHHATLQYYSRWSNPLLSVYAFIIEMINVLIRCLYCCTFIFYCPHRFLPLSRCQMTIGNIIFLSAAYTGMINNLVKFVFIDIKS